MVVVIKRIYDEAHGGDGYRVLVDRLWPRGVSKDDAALDEWCKDVAPSPELRKWFDHREDRFEEFAERYRGELDGSPELERLRELATRRRPLTLLYAAKDARINHAVVLADVVRPSDPDYLPPPGN